MVGGLLNSEEQPEKKQFWGEVNITFLKIFKNNETGNSMGTMFFMFDGLSGSHVEEM